MCGFSKTICRFSALLCFDEKASCGGAHLGAYLLLLYLQQAPHPAVPGATGTKLTHRSDPGHPHPARLLCHLSFCCTRIPHLSTAVACESLWFRTNPCTGSRGGSEVPLRVLGSLCGAWQPPRQVAWGRECVQQGSRCCSSRVTAWKRLSQPIRWRELPKAAHTRVCCREGLGRAGAWCGGCCLHLRRDPCGG